MARCQKYFASKYRIELTSEQAGVFLDSLGDLYLLVVNKGDRRRAGSASPSGAPAAACVPVTLDITNT